MTADTPEMKPTHERLADLEARVASLEAALADRDARIEELETRLDSDGTSASAESDAPVWADRYDMEVLAELNAGENVSANWIRSLYKSQTNISNDETARDRQITLVEQGPFEFIECGWWTYHGIGGAE